MPCRRWRGSVSACLAVLIVSSVSGTETRTSRDFPSTLIPKSIQGRGLGFGRSKEGMQNQLPPGALPPGAPMSAVARSMSHTTTGQGCNLNVISLQTAKAGEGLSEFKTLYHLGWFVGLNEVKSCSVPQHDYESNTDSIPDVPTNCRQDGAAQGKMMNPLNLPLRDPNSHYLSCSDGRSQYAVLASPGGDFVEFIHGLNALEKTIHMPLTPDGIDALFKEFLEYMTGGGKQYFYHHTDQAAHDKLFAAAGVTDPPNPLDADARRLIVRQMDNPEHVGCSHVRMLLEDDSLGVRRNVTKALLQSFAGVYYNPFDRLRERLIYPTLHGERDEAAVVNVASPEVCAPLAPMLVPQVHSASPTPAGQLRGGSGEGGEGGSGSGDPTVGTSLFLHHYVAAAEFRRSIAEFLAPKYDINPISLVAKMNRFAGEYFAAVVAKEMEGKPVYNAMVGP